MFILYKIGIFLTLTLSLKAAYRLADTLGSLYYFLAKRDRKIATDNIRIVLGQNEETSEVRYISRKVFINFARYLTEFFRTSKIDAKFIEQNVSLEGRENIDRALSLQKGALLVSAHLGNWEFGAIFLSMLGYKVNIIAWTHKNRLVDNFFLSQRQSKGVNVITLGTGIRKAFSALKDNEIVALLGDIDYANAKTSIKVKFFGQDALMPKGPAEISLRAGCPLVPTFLLREGQGRFRLILEEPIIYPQTGIHEDDLAGLTQNFVKKIEHYISRYPEQWFMLTPLWKQK